MGLKWLIYCCATAVPRGGRSLAHSGSGQAARFAAVRRLPCEPFLLRLGPARQDHGPPRQQVCPPGRRVLAWLLQRVLDGGGRLGRVFAISWDELFPEGERRQGRRAVALCLARTPFLSAAEV